MENFNTVGEERLRLVAKYGNWVVEQMEDEIKKLSKRFDNVKAKFDNNETVGK